MNNNPIIINKIPSTLFQQLLSATSTVERQVILKKYNELSLSTPTTLTEITQSKYLKWMDDFIESMNSENLNKIETLLKTFKDNSNDDDNNNNNNTTLMNAENIPKYLIETKLLSEENKDKFYSLLVSSFERRQHQIESLVLLLFVPPSCPLSPSMMLFGFDGAISFLGTSCSPKSAFEVKSVLAPRPCEVSLTTTPENIRRFVPNCVFSSLSYIFFNFFTPQRT